MNPSIQKSLTLDPILSNCLNLKQESPDYGDDQISCKMSSWLRKLGLEQVQFLFLQHFDVIFNTARISVHFILYVLEESIVEKKFGLGFGVERGKGKNNRVCKVFLSSLI